MRDRRIPGNSGRATMSSSNGGFRNIGDYGGVTPGYPGGNGGGGGGDSYTHVSYEAAPGVGSKVKNSLSGLLIGPVFIVLGCMLLWYNEGWAIKTHRSLNEALEAYISIPDATIVPTGENDNQLVHLSHVITVENPAVDHAFQLSRNAVYLERHVEIYQWVQKKSTERRKMQNGEVEVRDTYSYNKKWVGSPVNSGNFRHPVGHENYGDLPFRSETFRADGVKLGAYMLAAALTDQLTSTSRVPVRDAKNLPAGALLIGDDIYFPQSGTASVPAIQQGSTNNRDLGQAAVEKSIVTIDGEDKIIYTVASTGEKFTSKQKAMDAAAAAPVIARDQAASSVVHTGETMIGDVRINFTEVRCTMVSVLGKLVGRFLSKWPSKQGSGYDIGMLVPGQVSAEEMVSQAQATNEIYTWLKRAGGWFLNFLGFSMITSIISTTADITLNWFPILGPMATSIIDLGLNIANIVLATTVSLPVAAIAWVRYRPAFGVTTLACSLGLFYMASQAGTSTKARKLG